MNNVYSMFYDNVLPISGTPIVSALDPIDYEPKETFTNSSEYQYFIAFMEGLNLPSKFSTAELCQNNLVYFVDEVIIFENNATYETLYTETAARRPIFPSISFTQAVGGNFSEVFPNCYKTGEEVYDFTYALWVNVLESFNNLLISFLFTQMTYAIRYKQAIDRIVENEET